MAVYDAFSSNDRGTLSLGSVTKVL